MEANYVYTDTEVKYNTNYNNSLPLNDIILLGNKIWNEFKHDINNKIDNEELYDKYFNKYNEFGISFPLILRWMIQMNKYSEKAFKKFLLKYSTTNITCKKDFLILQADYIVFLYEESKHFNKKEVNNYREFIIKQLLDEENQLKKIQDEYKQEMLTIDDDKRKQLYNYLTKN